MKSKNKQMKEEKTLNPEDISIVVGYVQKSDDKNTTVIMSLSWNAKPVNIDYVNVKPGYCAMITNVSENKTSDKSVPSIMEIDGHYVYLDVKKSDKCDKYIGRSVEVSHIEHDENIDISKYETEYFYQCPLYKGFGAINDNIYNLMTKTECVEKTNQMFLTCSTGFVYYCHNGKLEIYEKSMKTGICDEWEILYVPILYCGDHKLMCKKYKI